MSGLGYKNLIRKVVGKGSENWLTLDWQFQWDLARSQDVKASSPETKKHGYCGHVNET